MRQAATIGGNVANGSPIGDNPPALIALGIGWAIMMPALMRLSEEFDGMPGPRRKWLRGQQS